MPTAPVLLTRRAGDDDALAEALLEAGLPSLSWPTSELRPIGDPELLRRRLQAAEATIWSDRTAVRAVAGLLGALPAGMAFAPGPGTGRELHYEGLRARVPVMPHAAGLVDLIGESGVSAVLVLHGDLARADLRRGLEGRGVRTEWVQVYQNRVPIDLPREEQALSAVVYASPSAAARSLAANPWLASLPTVVIGETTRAAAEAAGATRVSVSSAPTVPALRAAVLLALAAAS